MFLAVLVTTIAVLVAPLPERWQLRLIPADLPKLPGPFWGTVWSHGTSPRGGGGWTEWIAFAPGTDKTGAAVALSRTSGRPGREKETARTVPLAVHGPLVSFDGKLYTAALTESKSMDGTRVTPVLTLGAAVEFKPNAWYQAFTEEFSDGTARVTELLAEFAVDPRTNEEGEAKLRKYVRMAADRDGELIEFAGTFRKAEGQFGPARRITGSPRSGGTVHMWLELPYQSVAPRFYTAPALRLTGPSAPAPPPGGP
jgi:hypothetical protein